jgi:hypothetical protein
VPHRRKVPVRLHSELLLARSLAFLHLGRGRSAKALR